MNVFEIWKANGELDWLVTLTRAENVLGWRIKRDGEAMDELDRLGITAG